MPRMRIFFYLGGFLLVLAFFAAAAESIPRSLLGWSASGGLFVSAYEVLYAVLPGNLVVTQIQVEKLSPFLWDPILVGLLSLPGWVLLGVPGGALTWLCRPNKKMTAEQRDELKKYEESLFLLDELSREASEAGYYNGEDDQAPSHGHYENMEFLETEGGAAPFSEEQVLDDLEMGRPDGIEPDGKG